MAVLQDGRSVDCGVFGDACVWVMSMFDLRLYANNTRKSTTYRARARVFLPDYGSWKDRITTSEKIGGYKRYILLVG